MPQSKVNSKKIERIHRKDFSLFFFFQFYSAIIKKPYSVLNYYTLIFVRIIFLQGIINDRTTKEF